VTQSVTPGRLYRCSYGDHGRWYGKFCLYMGESIINRDDGVKITNHLFYIDSRLRLTDKTLLAYMKEEK